MDVLSKKAVILLLALSLLALPGCSGTSIYTNYHEVEDLELIRTVGVDKAANQVEVTICSGVGLSEKVYNPGPNAFYGAFRYPKRTGWERDVLCAYRAPGNRRRGGA